MKNIVAKIRKFLEPDKKKIILFAFLAAIMTLGAVQNIIISQREAGLPDSPIYSIIEGIQFGRSITYVRAPLEPFIFFASLTFGGIPWLASQEGVYIAISAIYLYVLSCLAACSWDLLRTRWNDLKGFIKPDIIKLLAFLLLFVYVFTGTGSSIICSGSCVSMGVYYLYDPLMTMEASYQEGLVYLLTLPPVIVYNLLLVVPTLIPGEFLWDSGLITYLFIITGLVYVYLLSCIVRVVWNLREDRIIVISSLFILITILSAPAVIRILAENSTDYYGYSRHKATKILSECPSNEEKIALMNACPSVGMQGSWEEMEKLSSSTIDDKCLTDAALRTWDKTLCLQVVDENSSEECIKAVQDKWDNTPKDSLEYKDAVAKYRCYYDAALEVRDVEICQWLPEAQLKKECEKEVIAANLAAQTGNGGAKK
jgi:hypothetical protein